MKNLAEWWGYLQHCKIFLQVINLRKRRFRSSDWCQYAKTDVCQCVANGPSVSDIFLDSDVIIPGLRASDTDSLYHLHDGSFVYEILEP